MTQPAKVQEPSMEEILASIRRIIADDESKPAEAAAAPTPTKPAPTAPTRPETMKPDTAVKQQPAAAKPAAAPPKPAAAANSQDDIDAMMASFEEPAAAPQAPAIEDDVLDLTDEMAIAVAQTAAASFKTVDPSDDLEFHETRSRSPSPSPASSASPNMLSQSTVSAVESAFNSLANTVLSNNARTLEDLVKEMLRPMLKNWLDDNLPGLVERIVKAEIERVSRGR
jgi:cell pole-organizing protein PopZ